MIPTTKNLVPAITAPATSFGDWQRNRLTDPPHPVGPPVGVKCSGCGRSRKIVTSANRSQQPLCSACNNLLRRHHGRRYAEVVADPAAAIAAIGEARTDRADRKKIRRDFFAVLNLLEEIDSDRHADVWRGFQDYFADLPEARVYLTFDTLGTVSKR